MMQPPYVPGRPRMVRLTDGPEIHYVGENEQLTQPRRSRLLVVRDVAAIVRDVLIILVIVTSVITAAQLIKAIQPQEQVQPAPSPTCIMVDPGNSEDCLVEGG